MKPQIAADIKGIATSYGDVLLRAWKESKDRGASPMQESMEEAIQGLIHDAIHASDSQYFRGIRSCLSVFHESKRLKDIDSLLYRIYGPILWRSLRCANAIVRAQSTIIFFDAFPLQASDSNASESDAIMQKQFDLLISLLKDNDHRVRAAAASGVCHILSQYWEALPNSTTRKILSFIVGTLGFDKSSVNVRLSVVNGLNVVLEQPLSHNVLKGLLPLLANTIHDDSERVRVAFINLLDKIKGIRGMHFYDIVQIEQLLQRLSEDAHRPLVCKAMTKLLLNSFYPQNDGEKGSAIEQTRRCIKLIRENAVAAEVFYFHFHEFCSVGNAAKLCVVLFSLFTHSSTEVDRQLYGEKMIEDNEDECNLPPGGGGKRTRGDDGCNAKITQNTAQFRKNTLSDPLVRTGILKVLNSCLSSICDKLLSPDCTASKDLINKYFTPDAIISIFNTFLGDEHAEVVVPMFLKIVSLINTIQMPRSESISDSEFSKYDHLSHEAVLQFYIECWAGQNSPCVHCKRKIAFSVVEFLCSIHKGQEILEVVLKSFNFLNDSNDISKSCQSPIQHEGGRKKKRGDHSQTVSKIVDSHTNVRTLPFAAAVELLGALIESNQPDVRKFVLRSDNESGFNDIFHMIQTICTKSFFRDILENGDVLDKSILVRCVHLWTSFGIHTIASMVPAVQSEQSQLSQLLSWVSDTVMTSLNVSKNDSYVSSCVASPAPPPRSKPKLDKERSMTEKIGTDDQEQIGSLAEKYLGAVILLIGDALVIKLEISDAIITLSKWIKLLDVNLERRDHSNADLRCTFPSLIPVFTRMLSLIAGKKVNVCEPLDIVQKSMLRIILSHVGHPSIGLHNCNRDLNTLLKICYNDLVLMKTLVAHIAKGISIDRNKDHENILWIDKSSHKVFELLISNSEAVLAAEKVLLGFLEASISTGTPFDGNSTPLILAALLESIVTSAPKKVKESSQGLVTKFLTLFSRDQENHDPVNSKILQIVSRIGVV